MQAVRITQCMVLGTKAGLCGVTLWSITVDFTACLQERILLPWLPTLAADSRD